MQLLYLSTTVVTSLPITNSWHIAIAIAVTTHHRPPRRSPDAPDGGDYGVIKTTAMLRLQKIYLLFYNSLQAFGWTISLARVFMSFLATGSVHGAYASAGDRICLLQTCAFLEILHGAIGIVPSGVLFPLMQWAGRTHFLLSIVSKIDEVQQSPSIFITFATWSLSDIIRYTHYAANITKSCPSWLTYLRYTAFIPLYPIGVAPGEMWLMYQALPFIQQKNLYADLFSGLPFSYYSFVKVLLFIYPFGWFKLYLHLFKQRKSKLGTKHEKKQY